MNVYLLSVIGTVLISAIITAILPEGKTATVVRNITKLACTVAILAPILNFFKTGELNEGGESAQTTTQNFSQTGIQTDEEFIQYYCEIRVRETERALEQELENAYALQAQVTLDWALREEKVYGLYDEQEIFIEKIRVLPQQTPSETNEEEIRRKWKESYGCEVEFE